MRAVDKGQRLRALLRIAPARDHPDQDVAGRSSNGRTGVSGRPCFTLVEVRLVAAVYGIQRVVDGEVHHRHGSADDDVVLAARDRGVESSHVPVEDLVGRRLPWRPEAY